MREATTSNQDSSKAERAGLRDLLRNRDFRLLWLAQVISDFGDNLTMLTLLLLVNNLTGSTAALATMLVVLAVPQITFGLVAGVYVDRLDRKRIMIISDALRGAIVLGFILVGSVNLLWLMYLLGFVQAAIGTFFYPARSALLPRIVKGESLLAANSVTQTCRTIAVVAGTAAAGVILGFTKRYWPTFTLDALTFFTSVLLVSRVRTDGKAAATDEKAGARAIFGQLVDGMRVIRHSSVLLGTLVAAAVMMLGIGAVNVLIIPLIFNDLHVPVTWFGAVQFAETSAMILSGSFVAVLAARFKPATMISVALLVLGLCTGLISAVGNLWHLAVILFVVGLVMTPLQAGVSTIVQTSVGDDLRGRTSAALNTIITTASLVSMALSGLAAGMVGVRNVFVIGGAITLLAGVSSFWMFRPRHEQQEAAFETPANAQLSEPLL